MMQGTNFAERYPKTAAKFPDFSPEDVEGTGGLSREECMAAIYWIARCLPEDKRKQLLDFVQEMGEDIRDVEP